MTKELVVATMNKGKLREIKELLADLDLKITSLADYPDAPEIIEDGETFEENALKKATTIGRFTKKLTLGEDSGLEVRALGNKPGIFSARFAGNSATDEQNNQKLLQSLEGIPLEERQARYQCFAALVDKERVVDVLSGSCEGLIGSHPKGTNGFGYDPLFYLPRYKKTFGQLDSAIKAKISHRARALEKVREVLKKYVGAR